MSTIINIYGGNNQILPHATGTVQQFCHGEPEPTGRQVSTGESCNLPHEAGQFALYINKVENLPYYLTRFSACTTASELARVVMMLLQSEPEISAEEVVKERFIRKILPLAPQITKGTSVDNVRAHINEALAKRPRKEKIERRTGCP